MRHGSSTAAQASRPPRTKRAATDWEAPASQPMGAALRVTTPTAPHT